MPVPPFFATPPVMVADSATRHAVKVCGIVSPSDASMVLRISKQILPPNFDLLLGMILWPNSKRSIDTATAREISEIAHEGGARPVAVFVDESIESMTQICKACSVDTAQLHGPKCRNAWLQNNHGSLVNWIDVRDVNAEGEVSSATESRVGPPLWSIFDSKGGGTGKPFDWSSFESPSEPWLLAGGLNPDNVFGAIEKLKPSGVDVAGGVAGEDGCVKDERRVRRFLEEVVRGYP